jgi:oxygen-independent coproporphyrinogen-3 oxidase
MVMAHNLYIHVPFCMSKCNYCAFFSVACNAPDWEKYANDICNELKFWSEKLGRIDIPTIFFGGGTPSLMPINIFEKIMNCISQCFNVLPQCEVTLESNPGTINKEKLIGFISNGVNRLSVGVQALNDEDLAFLGRKHSVSQAKDLLNNAMDAGIRVSADFIYGLPNQSEETVQQICDDINKLGLQHVSMYELTIEKNTVFGKMNLNMPDNETMAKMYNIIPEILSLPRYEVSNYALPGQECQHNQNVWKGDAYIGIGKGAAGRVCIDNEWYDELGNCERFEKIDNKTRNIEKILTGMRTIKGVKLDESIRNLIDFNWVKKNKNLVVEKDDYLYATSYGLLILDNLLLDLIK